jgi:aspartate/methionine/tyrosine aminotransferase
MTSRPGIAARGQVPPFHVMRILELAAARRADGLAVYDLSAGQPSTPAPPRVLAAAQAALTADRLGYTPALGITALRAAIAGHYRRTYAIDVDPGNVAVTTGSSGGFLLALLAAFEPGDTVVITRPGYPAYRNLLHALGCPVVEVAGSFQLRLSQLQALDELPAGIIIGSPSNPTGAMVDADELAAIVRWCDHEGVRLLSDEIYHGITYGEAASCARQTSAAPVVIGSFSKYFSMTGWRLGWLVLPDDLVDSVDRLAGNFALCPPTLAQFAALAAFDSYDDLDANVAGYAENRRLITQGLPAIGIDHFAPIDGAFYCYADVSQWTNDSLTFATRLLTETGVALASGIDFDPVDGGRFVRMCFAGAHSELVVALEVLGEWLAEQPQIR